MSSNILPRLIRLRDAPGYLGMDPNRFNEEVRPYLIEIPIGKQGIGFDRLDLDAWFEDFKNRNGRSGKAAKGGKPWDAKRHRASSTEAAYGTYRKELEVKEFEKALEQAILAKRKNS